MKEHEYAYQYLDAIAETLSSNRLSDTTNPALIVFDMQNLIASRAFNKDKIVSNIKLLVEKAHLRNKRVIYSQQVTLPFEFMGKFRIYEAKRQGRDPKAGKTLQPGSEEGKILKEISPSEQDFVIQKHQTGCFTGTPLDHMLKSNQNDSIILTGCSTHTGIEATARDAAARGYIPIIIEDAVGSHDRELHSAALKVMASIFEVIKTRDALDNLFDLTN